MAPALAKSSGEGLEAQRASIDRLSRIGLSISLLVFVASANSLQPTKVLQQRLKRFLPAVAFTTLLSTFSGKGFLEALKLYCVPVVCLTMVPWSLMKQRANTSIVAAVSTIVQPVVVYASIPLYSDVVRQLFFRTNDDDSEMDIAALIAIFVGICREQNVAAFVILLMLTGGEALEQ